MNIDDIMSERREFFALQNASRNNNNSRILPGGVTDHSAPINKNFQNQMELYQSNRRERDDRYLDSLSDEEREREMERRRLMGLQNTKVLEGRSTHNIFGARDANYSSQRPGKGDALSNYSTDMSQNFGGNINMMNQQQSVSNTGNNMYNAYNTFQMGNIG